MNSGVSANDEEDVSSTGPPPPARMPRDEEDDIPTREDEGEDKEDVKEVVVEEEPASIVIRQAASVFVRPPIKLWRATSSRPTSRSALPMSTMQRPRSREEEAATVDNTTGPTAASAAVMAAEGARPKTLQSPLLRMTPHTPANYANCETEEVARVAVEDEEVYPVSKDVLSDEADYKDGGTVKSSSSQNMDESNKAVVTPNIQDEAEELKKWEWDQQLVPGLTVEGSGRNNSKNVTKISPTANVVNSKKNSSLGMYNWQATKMTVKDRLAFMFNNEILADVHFIVGRESQQQRIPAHRFVLSVGSAVFDAMFNSTLATREDEIVLPDVEPASFLVLLKFLYSDEVKIGPETVMTTLYTAKKYAVPALEKHCVDFLKKNLSADNAFMLLTQARLFDEPQLAALCLETIDKYTPEALNAEGFTDIDVDTLSSVLDRDSLSIKEAKLFTALLRWAEAECARQGLPASSENKRSVLGHILTKIRFPLMTIEEFAQGPAQSGILTDRECVSMFLHFTVNPKPPVAFLDVPRCSITDKEQTVSRFQQIESRWGYSGTSDKIRFIVDRRIFVVGFGLYGSIHGPSEYQVVIQIFTTAQGRILGTNEASFLSDGTNSTFRVMFKEPIEILPGTNYTASAALKGLDSYYGTRGMRKVWVDSPTGGRVTFQFFYAAGNNNGTSVEDGQIPEIIFYT